MYPPEAPYTVYCSECWWSDKWDPLDYGRDYDFSRPFFEQLNEHLHKVPIRGLAVTKEVMELSSFTNHCDHSKNCYLIFYSDYNEDCEYGFYLARSKNLLDCSVGFESENCYDDCHLFRSNRVYGSEGNVTHSLDCAFLRDCENCTECFGSANLRNGSHVFFNEQLSKEEYKKRLSAIDLGSYRSYKEYKNKAEESWKKFPPQPIYNEFTTNSTGSYVFESKNCKECYDVAFAEDSKFLMLIKNASVKDSYDYVDWGEGAERIYEAITVGKNVKDVRFSQDVHASHRVEYSKSCMASSSLFACSGVRSKEYCVFNKRYSKEDFEVLRAKIIAQMDEMPYAGKDGALYRYGEFFPMELSPHDYNDTFAHMFYPLKKEEAVKRGLSWADYAPSEYKTTRDSEDLPDHIRDAEDDILNEVIKCETCSRGYRISGQELAFLRHHNLPLPRRCPFCRIEEKVKRWVSQMTLGERKCDKCGTIFETNYRTAQDAPVIYCKPCYIKEIV